MSSKFVVYYRKKKTRDVEDQRKLVEPIVEHNHATVLAEYIEAEPKTNTSKRRIERPQLREAISHAKREGATLVVAKIGRLVRNAGFTAALMESQLPLICCDNQNANELTIHILAAAAQDEAVERATRTKDAIMAAKAKGVKFGSARPEHWKGREHLRGWKEAVKAASEQRSKDAKEHYATVIPEIKRRREEGEPLDVIMKWLNDSGHVTRAGKPYTITAVWRLIQRYLGEEYLGKAKPHPKQ